jgi:hypothetical protein
MDIYTILKVFWKQARLLLLSNIIGIIYGIRSIIVDVVKACQWRLLR